ncbi:MAG: 50S ribosomal protein L4 [Spirochaetales bacterium]|nr:50S ribosomal protein L4 [Spirochaetales bacterium]
MKTKVFSIQGEEIKNIELNDDVFGREVNDSVIYYAIRNELANKRVGTASTKGRSEVRGSGAKPYRQKGTGRARAGHRRSPLWVGGGTVFGPKPRDYSYTIPKKMKRAAMKAILSLKVKEDRLRVVEDFTVESGKTRELVSLLRNLVKEERTVLILKDDDQMVKQAGRNIPWLTMLSYNRLRAHDLFYGKNLLVLETAAAELNEFYGGK